MAVQESLITHGPRFKWISVCITDVAPGGIRHISDVERSLAFYEAERLHIDFFMPYKDKDFHPDLWGFGNSKKAFFWLKHGKKSDPTAIHWGFMAEDRRKVDEFYKAAISAGARDAISSRARLEYHPGYYAPMYSTRTRIRSTSTKARVATLF